MKRAILIAKTAEGERELRKIYDKEGATAAQRIIYNRLFDDRLIKETPYTLEIHARNFAARTMLKAEDYEARAVLELEKNGVARGKDYSMVVE